MREWISAAVVVSAVVVSIALTAFVSTAASLRSSQVLADTSLPVSAWQTYCAVPVSDSMLVQSPGEHFEIEPLGRPSENIRSGHLFVSSEGDLVAWDVANRKQFKVADDGFEPIDAEPCPQFEAYGLTVNYRGAEGLVEVCNQQGRCEQAKVMPNTLAFSIAAADGAIFVGTSQGDTLVFREGK